MKLLSDVYLHFEDEEMLNADLTVALLSRGILPLKEWDRRFSFFVRDAPGNIFEKVVEFLVSFADSNTIRTMIESSLAEKQFPYLIKICKDLEKLSAKDHNAEMLTEQLSFVNEVFECKKKSLNHAHLKNLFFKWVESSDIHNEDQQQVAITAFFKEFGSTVPIEQDLFALCEFCEVMITTSIDLTTET
jgi:hypothetical protein